VRFEQIQKLVVGQSPVMQKHDKSTKKRRLIRSAAEKNLLVIKALFWIRIYLV